jgi:hypothetical protein
MNKLFIVFATTALFSVTANANSGLADRISDARSYPNKTVDINNSKELQMLHKKIHARMEQAELSNHNEASEVKYQNRMSPKKS